MAAKPAERPWRAGPLGGAARNLPSLTLARVWLYPCPPSHAHRRRRRHPRLWTGWHTPPQTVRTCSGIASRPPSPPPPPPSLAPSQRPRRSGCTPCARYGWERERGGRGGWLEGRQRLHGAADALPPTTDRPPHCMPRPSAAASPSCPRVQPALRATFQRVYGFHTTSGNNAWMKGKLLRGGPNCFQFIHSLGQTAACCRSLPLQQLQAVAHACALARHHAQPSDSTHAGAPRPRRRGRASTQAWQLQGGAARRRCSQTAPLSVALQRGLAWRRVRLGRSGLRRRKRRPAPSSLGAMPPPGRSLCPPRSRRRRRRRP